MIEVFVDFYEKNLNGAYAGDPHAYTFELGAAGHSLAKLHDIICQAVEIDGLAAGDYLMSVNMQDKNCTMDTTDFILHIQQVERTAEKSRYVKDGPNPPVMAINRDTFKYTLEFVITDNNRPANKTNFF